MTNNSETKGDVRAYWNSRAGLGRWAGTQDVVAKQIEMEVLAGQVRDGMRVLEIGCGNGITALEIARRHQVEITAIDFAEEMIDAARKLAEGQELKGTVKFGVGDVRNLAEVGVKFDLIYTERVLINLPDWPSQKQALADICTLLAPGGVFAMCENSQDGLDAINSLRARVNLPEIVAPWHNRYLHDAEINTVQMPGITLEGIDYYSSTYYLLSRVVNASLAAQEGKQPEYESPVNLLALNLPSIGEYGQGRLWRWRRST
jgi:ubiquinone/menaquinone biosynthesis C-methylase UbiE